MVMVSMLTHRSLLTLLTDSLSCMPGVLVCLRWALLSHHTFVTKTHYIRKRFIFSGFTSRLGCRVMLKLTGSILGVCLDASSVVS